MANSKPKSLPNYIQQYAFDFQWDNKLLWQLNVDPETMYVDELLWHLDVPWLHTKNGKFDVTPSIVIMHQDRYPEQYSRTMDADLTYPIDIMFNKGRWLILDGLHRLMKSVIFGKTQVRVRKIPRAMVDSIVI